MLHTLDGHREARNFFFKHVYISKTNQDNWNSSILNKAVNFFTNVRLLHA